MIVARYIKNHTLKLLSFASIYKKKKKQEENVTQIKEVLLCYFCCSKNVSYFALLKANFEENKSLKNFNVMAHSFI